MKFEYMDGGRVSAGFKGSTRDCVVRAVAIATEQPYDAVYAALSRGSRSERVTRGARAKTGASNGVHTKRKWFKDYMAALGWTWTPTMGIGTGCMVHLSDGELPMGRLIVAVSKHYTAVIDGVIHDTHDPQRPASDLVGGRCVYGYWRQGR
jgi:hypothetical protein